MEVDNSRGLLALIAAWLASNGGLGMHGSVGLQNTSPTDSAQVQASAAELPLTFISNAGQTDPAVRFHINAAEHTIFFSPSEVVFSTSHQSEDESMASSVVRLRFAGANPSPVLEGLHQQPGVANFFIGNDPIEWRTSVPTYGTVAYRGLYPGIDLVYLGKEGHLESEFVLAPGADPGMIQLAYSGLKGVSLREDGALVLQTEFGELVESAPILYQEIGKQRMEVEGSYQLLGGGQVGFQVGSYNASYPLVIDPSIEYSTYLGVVEVELGDAIAVDNAGFAYVTGVTLSIGFPTTTGVLQGPSDAFVAKLDTNATGAASLVYSTYLGGNSADQGGGIAVDGSGNAYVTGFTASSNFPTANPLDSSLGGVTDAFVAKLNNTGSTLVYSTYLGGARRDGGSGISLNGSDVYVTGFTESADFPTTTGAFDLTCGIDGDCDFVSGLGFRRDIFVTKIDPAVTPAAQLVYSTYLGGSATESGTGIAVDGAGNAYVAGNTNSNNFPTTVGSFQPSPGGGLNDAYVVKLDPTATGAASLIYSTYLGGSGDDQGADIAVNSSGNAYVTGLTGSSNFPTANPLDSSLGGVTDAFVAKLNNTGSTLVYSTYLGGSGDDRGADIAVNSSDNAYVTGLTGSSNFPTANPLDSSLGGVTDAFVAKLNNTGSTLVYSTYLGGSGDDRGGGIAVDAGDGMGVFNAYVIGTTSSPNLPTVNFFQGDNAGNGDTFVAKINDVTLDSIMVSIDIKPGSDPNCFNNNGNGVIPVAILGDANFDASLIDSGTVALEGLAVRAVGKSNKLLAHIKDVNTDGFDDLVVQIEDSDGVFLAGDTVATLTATLIDLTPIEGSDALCIVP